MTICIGCSSANRPSVKEDAGSDGDSDTETQSDSWDTDEPGLTSLSSTQVFCGPGENEEGRILWIGGATNGERIGLMISYDKNSDEYLNATDGVYAVTFPWDDPSDTNQGFYPPTSPACLDMAGGGHAQPYAIDTGFLAVAASVLSMEDPQCDFTLSEWSTTSELAGGPYGIESVYDASTTLFSMNPTGDLDDTGSVVIGRIIIEGGSIEFPPGSEFAELQLDRFGMGGAHETLLGPETFSWADLFSETGETSAVYQRTFVRGELVSVITVAEVQTEIGDHIFETLVAAQGTLDGAVTVPPRVAHVPPEHVGYPIVHGLNAFAAKEDEILAASEVVYEDGLGACITDRYTVRFDLGGNQLADPTLIESSDWCACADGEECSGHPSLEWSGAYYGYCDLEQSAEGVAYWFWILDAEGAPKAEPLALTPTISAPTTTDGVQALLRGYHCELVPLDEDTFAIAFEYPADIPDIHTGPTVWVAYANYQEIR